jgi:hypothetical protein
MRSHNSITEKPGTMKSFFPRLTYKSLFRSSVLFSGLILFSAVLLQGCSNNGPSPIEGTWRLAYEYEVSDGSSTCIFPGAAKGSELKMWTGNRWSLVGVFVEDSVLTDNFAGGTFTLEGTDYREMVEFHSAPEYLGQTVHLFLEIRNDTLVQIWPVDEEGNPVPDLHYMEKWVRMGQE